MCSETKNAFVRHVLLTKEDLDEFHDCHEYPEESERLHSRLKTFEVDFSVLGILGNNRHFGFHETWQSRSGTADLSNVQVDSHGVQVADHIGLTSIAGCRELKWQQA